MPVSITAYEPIDIDLWGEKFETVDSTRGAQKKATKLQREFLRFVDEGPDPAELEAVEGDEDKEDELIDKLTGEAVVKMGKLLDLKLQAVDGSKRKASTVLKKKWESEDLTIAQLQRFLDNVRSAEGEANRPSP